MDKKKQKVAILSVLSNSFLVISKLIIGISISSVSVISEAIHSGLDLLAAFIAYFAVKNSDKPPDKEHTFGHGKIENISGFIEAILIFIACLWIIYEAIHKLIYPQNIENIGLGIGIMFFSSIINIYVSKRIMEVAIETDSIALKADALHLKTDIYTSAGVMFALFLIWFIEFLFKGIHFHWLDPICAIGVSLLILKTAYRLTKESFLDLIDTSLNESEIKIIENYINSFNEILSFKGLKTRKAGNHKFIEVDIIFSENISLKKAHEISELLTQKIKKDIINSHINIHMEPCINPCPDKCQSNCSKEKE